MKELKKVLCPENNLNKESSGGIIWASVGKKSKIYKKSPGKTVRYAIGRQRSSLTNMASSNFFFVSFTIVSLSSLSVSKSG